MMNMGTITGREIGKNKDGDSDRVILQVEIYKDDVRAIELFSGHGQDINPANGCRVIILDLDENNQAVIAESDDLTPEVKPGEKEIYSTDSPVTTKKARLKWDEDSNLILNQGAKSSVTHAELNTALQLMLTALNADIVVAGGAGLTTLDISLSESNTVKLP